MNNTINPEIANSIKTGNFQTNYHDLGQGHPIIMVHGSGPGVTAWANWRLIMPELAKEHRVIAPDMLGFGYTERPNDIEYNKTKWVEQLKNLLDALNLEQIDLVGNSFGGSISIAFAIAYPERVRKLVLMGSVGVPFELTPGLNNVWGYEPSFENMRKLMDTFAYSRELVTDELAELRYQASIRPGFQESFSAMFPAPRQRWVDALVSPEADIRNIKQSTLILHGREDQVIPLTTSMKLFELITHSQLHIFGECGHWAQIEHSARFSKLLKDFFNE
ncbi:alpha/beta fold hydrolase [Acinetobacter baumannii]|uniref:alpha/beta fold hydrolase n=1 Tax=Acinetobacter baumannii TaxID=470 RepID=UPI0011270D2C|nr:alpha/beta hydrolase [Acinetobacter baumannii]MCT9253873.1 alpha/beta fold hydrolase [Acinetobacter baumannii]TPU92127.1 alpha/beta fold hydrolase [Acinetobacter baumannii]